MEFKFMNYEKSNFTISTSCMLAAANRRVNLILFKAIKMKINKTKFSLHHFGIKLCIWKIGSNFPFFLLDRILNLNPKCTPNWH